MLAALAIAVGAVLLSRRSEDVKQEPDPAKPAVTVKRPVTNTRRPPTKSQDKKVRKCNSSYTDKPKLSFSEDDDDDGFTAEERELSKRIEAALDDEDLARAVECAKDALSCTNSEIRQAMVDTLGWFGVKALPELTPFLADPDEDVRDSAMNEWSMAVSEIDDDREKLGVVELAMHVLNDEDALDDISGEYIGADEKIAVESLLRIIESGGSEKGIEKAKETYEFVTGDEFTNRAAAEKWIAEEYTPPDEV